MRYLACAKGKNLRLLDEIRYALRPEAERAGGKALGLKALTPGRGLREPDESHLANWVLARFFAMPRDQRDQFVLEGKGVVDEHLASDEPMPFGEARPFGPPDPPSPPAGDAGFKAKGVAVADLSDLGGKAQAQPEHKVK